MENNNTTQNVAQPAFEKQKIGEEKSFDAVKVKLIYDKITKSCTELKNQLQTCLNVEFSIDDFLNFLKSGNSERWIFNKFIKAQNIKIPGLSNEKIIELKLLDLDKVAVSQILQQHAAYKSILDELQNNVFFYPLRKLYDEDQGIFYTTGDLFAVIDNRFTIFTQTQEQNNILDVFTRLCNVLNELVELNILRPNNGQTEIELLSIYIKTGKNSSPFVVTPKLFSQHRLSKYKTKLPLNENKNINLLYA